MKNIILKKLIIKNFKGIKSVTIDFDKTTDIFGENGTGKSTIFDAFTWLLFDRDSQDRNKFDIQPLDKNNKVLHRVEVQVTGILESGGKLIELSKILKEKWVKKRGQADSELKGTETLYYKDEIPLKMSEYKVEINKIIDENIFKLITNPLYFSLNMKWQDRRAVLLDIVGDVNNASVINYKPELAALEKILGDKEIDNLKRTIAVRKKKLNEDIKQIPSRIDELYRTINDMDIDFDDLDIKKSSILTSLKALEEKIQAEAEIYEEFLKENNRLYDLKTQLRDIEYRTEGEEQKPLIALHSKLNEVNMKICEVQSKIKNAEFRKELALKSAAELSEEIEELREQWTITNKKEIEFSNDDFICTTCKRELEKHDIEKMKKEMTDNFNNNKAKALTKINTRGQALSEERNDENQNLKIAENELDLLNTSIKSLEYQSTDLKKQINNYIPEDKLEDNQEYQQIKNMIEDIEKKQSSFKRLHNEESKDSKYKNSSAEEYKAQKAKLEEELAQINKMSGLKDQNEKINERIQELTKEQNKLNEQIAELENQEYLCEQFMKAKVELLETNINNNFKFVKFKLFNNLVNGAVDECCEVLVNGIPFASANTAGKYNAGIDIINTLCRHYQVSAPIFIDGRESINEIIESNSQIINLKVTKDKELQINANINSQKIQKSHKSQTSKVAQTPQTSKVSQMSQKSQTSKVSQMSQTSKIPQTSQILKETQAYQVLNSIFDEPGF